MSVRGSWMTMNTRVDLRLEECYSCGVVFGMTQQTYSYFNDHHGQNFYCPNGHSQHYIGKTEEEKLRIQLANERERREFEEEQKEIARRQAAAARGQVTKIKKRVHNGVCAFCKRSFTNVQRHMEKQHPEEAVEPKEGANVG